MSGFNGPVPDGFRVSPENTIESIVSAVFDSVTEVVQGAGGKVRFLYVTLVTEGMGTPDACSGATGDDLPENPRERAEQIVAHLLSEAKSTAEILGADVRIMPLGGRNEG